MKRCEEPWGWDSRSRGLGNSYLDLWVFGGQECKKIACATSHDVFSWPRPRHSSQIPACLRFKSNGYCPGCSTDSTELPLRGSGAGKLPRGIRAQFGISNFSGLGMGLGHKPNPSLNPTLFFMGILGLGSDMRKSKNAYDCVLTTFAKI